MAWFLRDRARHGTAGLGITQRDIARQGTNFSGPDKDGLGWAWLGVTTQDKARNKFLTAGRVESWRGEARRHKARQD